MRPSELRTTSAVLRSIIGLSAPEMAQLLGCNVNTIKSLEAGSRLKLSKAMAAKMAAATGISEDWLLAGDPKKRATTPTGQTYRKANFEIHRAVSTFVAQAGASKPHIRQVHLAGRLCSILERATRSNRQELAYYKAEKMINDLAEEFGEEETVAEFPEKAVPLLKHLLDAFFFETFNIEHALVDSVPGAPVVLYDTLNSGDPTVEKLEWHKAARAYDKANNILFATTGEEFDRDPSIVEQREAAVQKAKEMLLLAEQRENCWKELWKKDDSASQTESRMREAWIQLKIAQKDLKNTAPDELKGNPSLLHEREEAVRKAMGGHQLAVDEYNEAATRISAQVAATFKAEDVPPPGGIKPALEPAAGSKKPKRKR